VVVVERAKQVPFVFYCHRKAHVSSKHYTQDLADAPGDSVCVVDPAKLGADWRIFGNVASIGPPIMSRWACCVPIFAPHTSSRTKARTYFDLYVRLAAKS